MMTSSCDYGPDGWCHTHIEGFGCHQTDTRPANREQHTVARWVRKQPDQHATLNQIAERFRVTPELAAVLAEDVANHGGNLTQTGVQAW